MRIGLRFRTNGSIARRQRREIVAEEPAESREAGGRACNRPVRRPRRALRLWGQFAEFISVGESSSATGTSCLISGSVLVRELFESVEGQAGLVLEGREGAEECFEVLVAARRRLEELFELRISSASCLRARGSAPRRWCRC